MNDVAAPRFDLTSPSKEELRGLVADLSEDERHVLLDHGTEAAFCGVFLGVDWAAAESWNSAPLGPRTGDPCRSFCRLSPWRHR